MPDYNARVNADPNARRIFSLDEARRLLPEVKRLTSEAVRQAERITTQLQGLAENDPAYAALVADLDAVVRHWARRVQALDLEVKGLWLVDFDNGDGYYCWAYPEDTISHYHDYADGFAGRMKII